MSRSRSLNALLLRLRLQTSQNVADELGSAEGIGRGPPDEIMKQEIETTFKVQYDILILFFAMLGLLIVRPLLSSIFLREFFYTFPIFIPVILFFEGRQGVRNRQYTHFMIGNQQMLAFVLLVAYNVIYIGWRPPYVSIYEPILIDLMYCIRGCVVATKYAYMSNIALEQVQFQELPFEVCLFEFELSLSHFLFF